jgi:hypothetical protein
MSRKWQQLIVVEGAKRHYEVRCLASMYAIQFAIATTNRFLFQALTRHLPRPATARQFSRSYPSPTVASNSGPSSPVTDDEVSWTLDHIYMTCACKWGVRQKLGAISRSKSWCPLMTDILLSHSLYKNITNMQTMQPVIVCGTYCNRHALKG